MGLRSSHKISQESHPILGLSFKLECNMNFGSPIFASDFSSHQFLGSKLGFSRVLGLGFSKKKKEEEVFAIISCVNEGGIW